MTKTGSSFRHIDAYSGAGAPLPLHWRPVTQSACLILVGLTGVGKTTILTGLTDAIPEYTLLPDRRTLTDLLMIPIVQRHDGLLDEPVSDRSQRFAVTGRYRALYPGGMAYALSTLAVAPTVSGSLIFDGLRGENEIRHAAQLMPRARFLMLDAPDGIRIERLLTRNDAFDAIAEQPDAPPSSTVSSFIELGLPDAVALLTDGEQERLLSLLTTGQTDAAELTAKTRIVLAERNNYDPSATRSSLEQLATDRSLIVDTAELPPQAIVDRTIAWLNQDD